MPGVRRPVAHLGEADGHGAGRTGAVTEGGAREGEPVVAPGHGHSRGTMLLSITHLLGGGVGSAVVGSSLQAGADRDGHVSTDAEYRLTVGDDVPLQQLHPVIRVHDHAHAEPGPAVGLQSEQVVLLPFYSRTKIFDLSVDTSGGVASRSWSRIYKSQRNPESKDNNSY